MMEMILILTCALGGLFLCFLMFGYWIYQIIISFWRDTRTIKGEIKSGLARVDHYSGWGKFHHACSTSFIVEYSGGSFAFETDPTVGLTGDWNLIYNRTNIKDDRLLDICRNIHSLCLSKKRY